MPMTEKEWNKYLKKHPFKNVSFVTLLDYQIDILKSDEATQIMTDAIKARLAPGRLLDENNMTEAIAGLTTSDEFMRLMRRAVSPEQLRLLLLKAGEIQEDVGPMIVKRYLTSVQDEYIENAAKILACSDKCYTQMLLEQYNAIRFPYAQSVACYLFGYKKLTQSEALLLREYDRFKSHWPQKSFEQGPLWGLSYLMEASLTLSSDGSY